MRGGCRHDAAQKLYDSTHVQVRSQHFFEAASVVAELRASLARTYEQVLDMRGAVRAVDRDVVQAADTVQVGPSMQSCFRHHWRAMTVLSGQ